MTLGITRVLDAIALIAANVCEFRGKPARDSDLMSATIPK
jgi:hypothetical protein